MKLRRESERGFTMVEMIVIVAVLVILGGALTPVVIKQVQKSKDQSVVDDFKAIETAVTRYHIDIGTFTPLKNIKGKKRLIACSHEDYLMASQKEIPDRWWKAYQKIN